MTVQIATRALDPPPTPPAFRGFQSPNYTPVPDELFDELLTELSGAELKVLLYVIRRTFGFKRDHDRISLSQMLHGIQTRDGRTLHRGVGLCKPTLLQALRSLQSKGIVSAERQRSAERGDEPTVYALKFAERTAPATGATAPHSSHPWNAKPPVPPVVKKGDQGGGQKTSPGGWATNLPTQQTGPRQTQRQHHPRPPSPPAAPESRTGTLAPTASIPQEPASAVDDAVLDLLLSQGVTRRIATDLVAKHPRETIRQQVEWQRYRPTAQSPAGALVQAIRDGWPAPAAWVEAQEHDAAAIRQREEDVRREAEHEACRREWEAKPLEERIAGRLAFWIQGRRAKRHEPSGAEIAARRAELLAEVAQRELASASPG